MATTNSSAPTSGTVYRRLLGYAARQWPLLVLAIWIDKFKVDMDA